MGRGRSTGICVPDTAASSGAAVFLRASGGRWGKVLEVNSVLPECVEGADRVHSEQNMVNDEDRTRLRLSKRGLQHSHSARCMSSAQTIFAVLRKPEGIYF